MQAVNPANTKPTLPAMRLMLYIAGGLVFITGIQLFILTEYTERFFAWTIQSPLTAAFLGAAYWASCALEVLAARQRLWAHARIAVPTVLLFTTLTLVVTILHIGNFHLAHPDPLTRTLAWAWVIVYASVPLLLGGLLLLQARAPGSDPVRTRPLPLWLQICLVFYAAIMIPLGLGMLLIPDQIIPHWPWALTPLTCRAIGAWFFALGFALAHTLWENDWRRIWVETAAVGIFALLELVAVVRYPAAIDWSKPQAWIYIVLISGVLALGAYGWYAGGRTGPEVKGQR